MGRVKMWMVKANGSGWFSPSKFYFTTKEAAHTFNEALRYTNHVTDGVKYAGMFREDNAEELTRNNDMWELRW